jgi:hypothetical protein
MVTQAKQHLNAGLLLVCVVIAIGMPSRSSATAPSLYRQPAYESPVRGEPDDLLLLAGYGFAVDDQVVFQSAGAATDSLQHPSLLPTASTAELGVAEVVSTANVPYSLTVRLPKFLRVGQVYALWVRNAQQEWSKSVFINDARPYWISPAYVYASAAVASLPRYLKVVGRNLQPAIGSFTEVRLIGPQDLVLKAQSPDSNSVALDHYVAQVNLPRALLPGTYRIKLRRDGTNWVDLGAQTLEVRPDPSPVPEFPVDSAASGACRADDGADDVPCVMRAIAAAHAAGGGTVVFGPGTWNLSGVGVAAPDGIVVPVGVNLRGAGVQATHIVRQADWNTVTPTAAFTLMGHNIVEGIAFRDARVYGLGDVLASYLTLGLTRTEDNARGAPPGAIEDVVITKNLFDRPYFAIGDGGAPIDRLFVTYNEFGAYRTSLELAGNRLLMSEKFRIDDSVIAFNTFKPGSHLDVPNRQGAGASEIGASHRVDFSNNTADGTATDYLYSLADAHGWRAGFFWHMNNNQEMLLISNNTATCTGDKVGDGEAIALDNNGNTFALDAAASVIHATGDSITIAGPLQSQQYDRPVQSDTYYQGHWIQVGEGPGVGQARKIVSYQINPSNGQVVFKVAPKWDVIPADGKTRISIGREFWQTYIVGNTVDHRKPLCQKSNRSNTKAGVIILWAQTADSAVEGNQQYDTDGIAFQQLYNAQESGCHDCDRGTSYFDFVEIRGNLIDGEYDWGNGCSSSGIFGSIAAGPTTRSAPPPTVSYGLSISHNMINHADGLRGGAIAFSPTWYQGPAPYRWPLVRNALIYQNKLTGLDTAPAKPCHNDSIHQRTGISLGGSSLVWGTVLYANACPDARRALDIAPRDVNRVCPPGAQPSCECAL